MRPHEPIMTRKFLDMPGPSSRIRDSSPPIFGGSGTRDVWTTFSAIGIQVAYQMIIITLQDNNCSHFISSHDPFTLFARSDSRRRDCYYLYVFFVGFRICVWFFWKKWQSMWFHDIKYQKLYFYIICRAWGWFVVFLINFAVLCWRQQSFRKGHCGCSHLEIK